MDISQIIADELKIKKSQVDATVKLIDEGNTIPFIARYRKEATGSLNDEVLRNLHERLLYLRNLEERKAQITASIEEQGKMTEELQKKITEAQTMVVLEDLYRPYKPKRTTRAMLARERGLEPLANAILAQNLTVPVEELAKDYIDGEKKIPDVKAAISGAQDIIAEDISDNADYRAKIREMTFDAGVIKSAAKDPEQESVYEMYYEFSEAVNKIAGHRVLALNRGENEKILTVKIVAPTENILRFLNGKILKNNNEYTTPVITAAIEDGYERLIAPSIEREIRNELTEKAEDGAIAVFGKNLSQLLMAQPIAGKVVLGWDPAFRTGCKLAIVDATGKVLDTKVIYPTAPQNKVAEAKAELKRLISKYKVDLISLGNGTASRESEQIIVELLKEIDRPVSYVIVSEAGASVYSASKLATEEFPQFDVGQRSAASIARRLQDPLAELVKIDPKSIGVGQYQHDMNQKKLDTALQGVVEDNVNRVGVDLNTASAPLLAYISGISPALAKNIVSYREENGSFKNRKELLKVSKLGPKAFEQCAGFLRIRGGDNPLDETGVHPESYEAAGKLMEMLGLTLDDIRDAIRASKGADASKGTTSKPAGKPSGNAKPAGKSGAYDKKTMQLIREIRDARRAVKENPGNPFAQMNLKMLEDKAKAAGVDVSEAALAKNASPRDNASKDNKKEETSSLARKITDRKKVAEELGIGEITLNDIIQELEKPSRDPREDMPAPVLRNDVLSMEDLKPGMVLRGTVRNAIDFGVFVDIGVHQDGLVHISQITDRYIKHPLEAVSVGDVVDVKVLDVDLKKQRISLSMKL